MAQFYIKQILLWHYFGLVLSCPQFSELYLENSRININDSKAVRRHAPSALTCTHICALKEGCTAFNFCKETENGLTYCEFFNVILDRTHLDEILAEGLGQGSSQCSIYLMMISEDDSQIDYPSALQVTNSFYVIYPTSYS